MAAPRASGADAVVTTWEELRSALSNSTVASIDLGGNIQRPVGATTTATDLPAIGRTLTLDGQGFSLDFRPGGQQTVIARSGFFLTNNVTAEFTLQNINIIRPNGGLFALVNSASNYAHNVDTAASITATQNWTVHIIDVTHSVAPSSGLVTLPGGAVHLAGQVTWDSVAGTNSEAVTINAREVMVDGADTDVRLRNDSGTTANRPLIKLGSAGRANSVLVSGGAHVFLENRGTASTQVVEMLGGTSVGTISEFIVDGEGTYLEVIGWGAGTGETGGTITMTAANAAAARGGGGGFQVTGGAKMDVYAARAPNATNAGMPALIQQIDGGEFVVDGEGSELIVRSDGCSNNLSGAIRIRLVGNQSLAVTNLGKLTVYRPLRNDTMQCPGIRFGDGSRNEFTVNSGGLILVNNEGGSTISTADSATTNAAVVFNASGFTFDVSGGKENRDGEWIPSAIELLADKGPAIGGGAADGTIRLRDGAVFLAEGNVNSTSNAVISAGARFTFETNAPQYYNFQQNNERTGAMVFDTTGAAGRYYSVDTDIAVWGNGLPRATGAANTSFASFNPVGGDPYRTWTLADFELSGANFPTLVSSADPTFNTDPATSFGSRGMVPYHRVSGNNAPPVIRTMTQPTNADLYVRGTGTVAEGLDFYGRAVWTDEVWSRWEITSPLGVTSMSGQGQSSSVNMENLYTVETGAQTMNGTVRYSNGQLLVTDTTYELVSAWRGPFDDPSNPKKHESDPAKHILTSPVTVIDVMPPVPATITSPSEILIGGQNTVTGTWLTAPQQAAAEPNNPDPAVAISAVDASGVTVATGTLNSDGTWVVDLPTTVTDSLSSGDRIYFVLEDGLGNANPLVDTPIHDTTKLAAPFLAATLAKILAEDFTITANNADNVMNASNRDAQLIALAQAMGRMTDADSLSPGNVEVVSVGIPTPATPGDYPVTFQVMGKPEYSITITAHVIDDTFSCDRSSFTVDPAVTLADNSTWKIANGADFYTGTLSAKDEDNNPMRNLTGIDFLASATTVDISTMINNGDGTYTVTYTTMVADPTYTASVHVSTCQVGTDLPIPFKPGSVSQRESTFTVTPAVSATDESMWIVANGTDYYTGTLTARDESRNPLSNLDASIIFVASSPLVNITAVSNEGDGVYTVQFTTTKADPAYLASVSVEGLKIGNDEPIPFKAGPISWTKSTLTVDYTLLGVGNPAQATATLLDNFDNPIEGVAVTFALAAVAPATSHDATLAPTSGIVLTDEYGKAYASITDNTAETVSLSAMALDGTTPRHLTGSPVDITWEAGDIDATESSFRVYITDTTATQVRADGTGSWTGELTARDSNRNLLVDLTPAQLATLTWGVTPGGVTVSSVTSAGAGVYTVTYTTTKAGPYTATLHTGASQIGANEPILFVPGPVDPDRSTVSVNPSTTAVGTIATVTVVVVDAYDNPIPHLTNTPATGITITGTATGLPDVTMMGAMTETADGVYEFPITSYKVGTFTITATVTDITLTAKPTVSFTPGGVSAAHSSFEMVDNNALADGTAKNSARATARDQYENVVPGATVIVEDKTTATELMGYLTPATFTGTTDSNGEVMIYWTSAKKGTFTAEGTIDSLRPPTGVMSQITFTTGLADANNSTMTIYPASPIQVGNIYTVTATIRDSNNLLLEDERVEFTLDPATPASLSTAYCMTNAVGQCSVSVTSLLVTDVTVNGFVTGPAGLSPIAGHGVPAQASGQTVSFTHGPVCLPPDVATPVDPTHISRVEVTTPGAEANGTDANYATVYAYDCYGNPVVDVAISSSTTVTQLVTTYRTTTTQSDGTAVIEYRSTLAGAHDAIVRIDGRLPAQAISFGVAPRSDGQITLNFGSGVAVAGNSYLTISPTTSQEVGSTFTVTATLRDATLNPVSGTTILFTSGADLTFTPQASCISGPDGTCQVSVRSTKAGTYEIKGFLGLLEVSNSVQATFTPGPVCILPTCLTRVEVTVNGQKADGTSRNIATVYAFDLYDNPVPNAPVTSAPTSGTTGLTVQPNPAPTSDQGISTIWYTATATGIYDADVSVAGLTPRGSPVSLFFGVGDGDPAHSQWDITPAGPLVVGEGAANTYTARVIVRDEDNILVPGEIVTFAVDRSGPIPGPNPNSWSCMTATDGTCTITIHSTVAGTYSFTARLATGSIMNTTTSQPATSRAWKADEVCSQAEGCDPVDPNLPASLRTRIVVTTNNATADGIARNEITAWGFDKWGNPVVGARVDSTRVTSTDPITIQTGINPLGEDGSSVIWYTSMVARDYQINVAIDDVRPVGSPATLTFTPGQVCVVEAGCEPTGPGTDPLKQTRVAVTTNNNPVDGAPNVATAWAFDRTGNAVPNVEFTFVKALATSNLVIDSTCTTTASGQCTVNATAKLAGDHQARALVAGTELSDHGSPLTFTFVTGELCIIEAGCTPDVETPPSRYTRVELLDNNAHVVRGGVTPEDRHLNTIGVYAFDKYGNPVSGAVFDLVADTSYLKFQTGAVHLSSATLTSTANVAPDTVAVYTDNNEDHWVSASVNGVELTMSGSPLEVWFVDPPVITYPANNTIINDSPIPIAGTATNAGSIVDVFVDGMKVCEATIQADHTWTCNAVGVVDGSHIITAQKHSRDGLKRSEISDPVSVRTDTVPPSDPIVDPTNGSKVTGTTDPDTTVTVYDEDGKPIPGCVDVKPDASGHFECYPQVPLKPGDTITVIARDEAGNGSNPVKVTVRGIGILVLHPVRQVGEPQVVTGLNFNPGEKVRLVVTSDPLDVGTLTVNADGTVTFNFDIPADFEAGAHTARLIGQESGEVSGGFEVVIPIVPTGGYVI